MSTLPLTAAPREIWEKEWLALPENQPQNSHLITHCKSFLYIDVSKPFQSPLSVLKYVGITVPTGES